MPSHDFDSRVQSPRPGTPEPSSRQGRRNNQPDAQLLDDDGAISQKVSRCVRPRTLRLTRVHVVA